MRMLRWFRAPRFFCTLFAPLVAIGQTSGPGVNMVSGTGWTNGDPVLERQNEPSLAVSTRNTLHLFGGANDYRSADLAGLAGQSERADGWLGVFNSFDGRQTWQSTLLPGYPLDSSPVPKKDCWLDCGSYSKPSQRGGSASFLARIGILAKGWAIFIQR